MARTPKPKPEQDATPATGATQDPATSSGGTSGGTPSPPDVSGADASGPALLVRTKGRKGFRRAGMTFGPEAATLAPGAFERGLAGGEKLLAILSEPALACSILEDGAETPITDEQVLELRIAIEAAREAQASGNAQGLDEADFAAAAIEATLTRDAE